MSKEAIDKVKEIKTGASEGLQRHIEDEDFIRIRQLAYQTIAILEKEPDLQAKNKHLRKRIDVIKHNRNELFDETVKLQAENKLLRRDLIELMHEFVSLNCTCQNGTLDSMVISTNAEAMRFLAREGIIEITNEAGRRVIGKWKEQALNGGGQKETKGVQDERSDR